MVRKIEVLIVDDEEFFREALVEIVKSFEDLTVVGDMSSGATALQFLENNACDVVLCDVRMPHMNGRACQVVCVWGVIIRGRARSGPGRPQTSG